MQDLFELDIISEEHNIYCFTSKFTTVIVDLHGRSRTLDQYVAGMGSSKDEALFKCSMEKCERISATSASLMLKSIELNLKYPILDWHFFYPYTRSEIDIANYIREYWPKYLVHSYGLISKKSFAIPAECVFPWWRSFYGTPYIIPECDGVGVAAGFTDKVNETIERAYREVIERDAVMLSWRLKEWEIINLGDNYLTSDIKSWIASENLNILIYNVGDEKIADVVMVLLYDENFRVTIGCSCSNKIEDSVRKAVFESIMLRGSALMLDLEYPKFEDDEIIDSFMHVLYGWRNGQSIIRWYNEREFKQNVKFINNDFNQLVKDGTEVFGHEPLVINLTDVNLLKDDIVVYRVLQPNAYKKEYDNNKKLLGGTRLTGFLEKGYTLNLKPHPIG